MLFDKRTVDGRLCGLVPNSATVARHRGTLQGLENGLEIGLPEQGLPGFGKTSMICPRCSTENSSFETRCVRCGSRFGGDGQPRAGFTRNYGTQGATARPFVVPRETRYSSVIPNATVAAAQSTEFHPGLISADSTARELHPHERPDAHPASDRGASTGGAIARATPNRLEVVPPGGQPSLFSPADFAGKPASLRIERTDASQGYVSAPKRKPARRRRKSDMLPFEQGTLDFLTPTSAPAKQLQTSVDAAVLCDHPVASPMHRTLAAAWDTAAILISTFLVCVVFAAAAYLLDMALPLGNPVVQIGLGSTLLLVGLAYHAACCLLGWDTPGMRAVHLKLVTLDGSTPTNWQRWKRMFGALVGLAAGGAGFLWALCDEEHLGWHDQVSQTFPTPRMHVESSFHRR